MSKWIEIGVVVVLAIIAIRVISDFLGGLSGGASATVQQMQPAPPAYVQWIPPRYRNRGRGR
jgi:hypothetical protein